MRFEYMYAENPYVPERSTFSQKDVISECYHGLDALRKEEAVVERVHGVIRLHGTLLLQQDWPSVQSIISPENCETGFLISLDQSPSGTHTYIQEK